MLITDIDGILDADGSLISELDPARARRLIAAGTISGGMIPKVLAGLRAVEGGSSAHVIDGRVPHSLLLELLTESGVGTMLREGGDDTPEAA
jgi:acetylglutamate kinase